MEESRKNVNGLLLGYIARTKTWSKTATGIFHRGGTIRVFQSPARLSIDNTMNQFCGTLQLHNFSELDPSEVVWMFTTV